MEKTDTQREKTIKPADLKCYILGSTWQSIIIYSEPLTHLNLVCCQNHVAIVKHLISMKCYVF